MALADQIEAHLAATAEPNFKDGQILLSESEHAAIYQAVAEVFEQAHIFDVSRTYARQPVKLAGIAVQVVNGITAGLAGMTLLGAPLTDRRYAHGVVFVTGHNHPAEAGTDWRQLGAPARDARLTLVIYMGIASCARIQRELLDALPAHTPAAVIQHVSLPQQRHALIMLGALQETIARERLTSPSVIVIGAGVRGIDAAQATGARPA